MWRDEIQVNNYIIAYLVYSSMHVTIDTNNTCKPNIKCNDQTEVNTPQGTKIFKNMPQKGNFCSIHNLHISAFSSHENPYNQIIDRPRKQGRENKTPPPPPSPPSQQFNLSTYRFGTLQSLARKPPPFIEPKAEVDKNKQRSERLDIQVTAKQKTKKKQRDRKGNSKDSRSGRT